MKVFLFKLNSASETWQPGLYLHAEASTTNLALQNFQTKVCRGYVTIYSLYHAFIFQISLWLILAHAPLYYSKRPFLGLQDAVIWVLIKISKYLAKRGTLSAPTPDERLQEQCKARHLS